MMSDIRRFETFRFLGDRQSMEVYDTEDAFEHEALKHAVEVRDLAERNLIQSFAPDTVAEARNRGFSPVRLASPDQ